MQSVLQGDVSTRSSINIRESRRRCISFSMAYAQKAIEISTTAIRSTDGVMSERTGVFGHSEIDRGADGDRDEQDRRDDPQL